MVNGISDFIKTKQTIVKTVMVCDEFNDLAAACQANLSIAMTSLAIAKVCTDITISSLSDILVLQAISQLKHRFTRQNIALLLIYNLFTIMVTSGLLGITVFPGMGCLMMLGSFLIMAINTCRLFYIIANKIKKNRQQAISPIPSTMEGDPTAVKAYELGGANDDQGYHRNLHKKQDHYTYTQLGKKQAAGFLPD